MATLVAGRSSLDGKESNAHIDRAKLVTEKINAIPLSIVQAKADFEKKINEFNEVEPATAFTPRQLPSHITSEVEAQLSFLRKLKVNYLEQHAKDKYIKTIVDDEAEIIKIDDNEALRQGNLTKKASLKEAKIRLAGRCNDVRELASEVESKYRRAEMLKDQFAQLTSQILDARLAISRLRTAHPLPRLSVAAANATLESQVEQMADLDAQISGNAARVDRVKEKVQNTAREVERLRNERAAQEEEARQTKGEEEDGRIIGLYDWFSTTLSLHRSIFSLISTKTIAENELELTYDLSTSKQSDYAKADSHRLVLTLLFQPNTRILAEASVSSPYEKLATMNLEDLIGSHVQSNDVFGLIRGILARARLCLQVG